MFSKKSHDRSEIREHPIDKPGRCYGCGKKVKSGYNIYSPKCSRLAMQRDINKEQWLSTLASFD